MDGDTPRRAQQVGRSKTILIGAALLLVYCLAIWFDWPPPGDPVASEWWQRVQALRGWSVFPYGWAYGLIDPAPVERWLVFVVLGLLGAGVIYLHQRKPVERRPALPLGLLLALTLIAVGLQLAALWLKNPNAVQLLLHRITSSGFTGYYTVAMQTPQVSSLFSGYDELLTDPATGICVHCLTHPPGSIMFYWLLFQGFELLPAEWVQGLVSTLMAAFGLHDPVAFAQFPPPDVPVAFLVAFVAGFGLLFAAGLIVFPLYGLARRLAGPRDALPLAALGVLIPGMLVMTPEFDPLFATLAVTAIYLTLYSLAVGQRRFLWGGLIGLLVGVGSYLSLGMWVLGALVLLIGLASPLNRYDLFGIDPQQPRFPLSLGTVAGWVAGLAAGFLLPWGLLWLAGLDLLRMAELASASHFGNVNETRPYDVYLLFNIVEFVQSAGLPLVIVAVVEAGRAMLVRLRPAQSAEEALPGAGRINLYALLFVAIPLLLDVVNSVRGETARTWIFLMPLACLACYCAAGRGRLGSRSIYLLLAAQFVISLLIAGRWFTPG